MAPILIVVNNPDDWPLELPGVQVVSSRAYCTNPDFAKMKGAKLFNLCRSYRYQALGYYVSLLAEARGHKPLPAVHTIQDLKLATMMRLAGDELDDQIAKSLAPIQSDAFTLSIYFGKNTAKRYDRLSQQLFRLFPAPLLRAYFKRDEDGWIIQNIEPVPASEIPESHRDFVVEAAKEYLAKGRHPGVKGAFSSGRYNLAILHNPQEEQPPSDMETLEKFIDAGEKADIAVDLITREDYAHLAEYDALFIRETTNVNHHTYRFARRAQAEGLVVIDDPQSIMRCSNKVYLAELMERAKVPTPRTAVVHSQNIDDICKRVGVPCILKQPDSAFSRGVIKVETPEDLEREARRMLEKSDLVIAQEFMPTAFDWRVGVLDRQPIFVCKYHMSGSHWQVVQRDEKGNPDWGRTESIPLWQAPKHVVETALKACNLIGDSLYGVDIKEVDGKCFVMEVNDNPDILAGYEDRELKDELYERVIDVFLKRIEKMKEKK